MTAERPVVVGVSLNAESGYVLDKVVGLAGDPKHVIAVHAIERSVMTFDEEDAPTIETLYQHLEEDARSRLASLCESRGITDHRVLHGNPVHILHEVGEANNALVLAVGSHGREGWQALLGETAEGALRDTRNSVLAILVRNIGDEPVLTYNRVLIAVDLSEESAAVVDGAARVRDMFGAELTLMSCIKPVAHYTTALDETSILGNTYATYLSEAEEQYQERLTELANQYNIEDVIIRHGYPAAEIHDTAACLKADLVALGTHGTHGPALLLGSTPNAVLHGMKCDVLAVRVGRTSRK